MKFQHEIGGIYRLRVPFENLYTSVFLIKTNEENILVDTATFPADVDMYILPALKEMGLCLTDIKYLILTHKHDDHIGGKNRIVQLNSNIRINEQLPSSLSIYDLKGHTLDCIGVFERQTGTLISGDGLQGAGIGRYRCSLENEEEYLKTIEKIDKDDKIENILFSHAYEPWYIDYVKGREQIKQCLKDCKNYI